MNILFDEDRNGNEEKQKRWVKNVLKNSKIIYRDEYYGYFNICF